MKMSLLLAVSFFAVAAQASSGQALRENIEQVQETQNLTQKGRILGQVCHDRVNQEYVLFTSTSGDIIALSLDHGFSSSTGEEGVFMKDTAELINLSDCSTTSVRF